MTTMIDFSSVHVDALLRSLTGVENSCPDRLAQGRSGMSEFNLSQNLQNLFFKVSVNNEWLPVVSESMLTPSVCI